MAKKNYIFLSLILLLFCTACANQGTEVGNPGKRLVSGTLAASVNLLNAKSVAATASAAASCPSTAGDITVIFRTRSGTILDSNTDNVGVFSLEINTTQNYEIIFRQNNTDCGALYYDSDQNNPGLHVVLGNGTQDIDLGDVSDLGDGVFVAQNNPSSYCDNDGDGVTDDEDNDSNEDGVSDTDDDNDGYLDWFEDETGEL